METATQVFRTVNSLVYALRPNLIRRYRRWMGAWPNVAKPFNYTERMIWRKVFDRNPFFPVFADKLGAKEYIQNHCPNLPLAPVLWIGQSVDEIPEDLLMGDVFLKANHGCKFNYEIRNGCYNRSEMSKIASRWLSRTWGQRHGEWAYSAISPKLFLEGAIGDASKDLIEFHVRASNGRILMSSVIGHNKTSKRWWAHFDVNGSPMFGPYDKTDAPIPQLPHGIDITSPLEVAQNWASQLSEGVDFARYDFFWNGESVLGGEITVYPSAGSKRIANDYANCTIMSGWNLLDSHFFRATHKGLLLQYSKALEAYLRGNEPKERLPMFAT